MTKEKTVKCTVVYPYYLSAKTKEESVNNVRYYKSSRFSRVVDITPTDLAKRLEMGLPFHPQVHNLQLENAKGKCTIREESFIATELFAVDIDHGDFTYEALLEKMNQYELYPLIIYKTQSYGIKGLRWRVVFHVNRMITDKKTYKEVISYLMYVFGAGYDEVDVSGADLCRIAYGAKAESHAEVFVNNVNNVNALVQKAREVQSLKWLGLDENGNKPVKVAKVAKGAVTTTTSKTAKSTTTATKKATDKDEADLDRLYDICEVIEVNLRAYAKRETLPLEFDRTQMKLAINQLPLSELFGVRLNELFNCVFHNDSNPSANIIKNGAIEVYHCFACDEHPETPYDVLFEIFSAVYSDNMTSFEKRVCKLLGVQYGSNYQLEVRDLMTDYEDWLFRESMRGEDDRDALVSHLLRTKTYSLLEVIYKLGKEQCPLHPIALDDEEGIDAHLFVSQRYLNRICRDRQLIGNKSLANLQANLKLLQRVGLIEAVEYENISDYGLNLVTGINETARLNYVNDFLRKIVTQEADLLKIDVTRIDVKKIQLYRIKRITAKVRRNAIKQFVFEQENKVRKTKASQKGQQLIDAELTDKVYKQTKAIYDKYDKKFLKDAVKLIDEWLETQHYFTAEQLQLNVDATKSVLKSKAKRKELYNKYIDVLKIEKGLQHVRASKKIKEEYDIADHNELKHTDFIFVIKK